MFLAQKMCGFVFFLPEKLSNGGFLLLEHPAFTLQSPKLSLKKGLLSFQEIQELMELFLALRLVSSCLFYLSVFLTRATPGSSLVLNTEIKYYHNCWLFSTCHVTWIQLNLAYIYSSIQPDQFLPLLHGHRLMVFFLGDLRSDTRYTKCIIKCSIWLDLMTPLWAGAVHKVSCSRQ